MSTKIKFLADESMEYSLVLHFRKQDYDILSVAEDFPSLSDENVLARAFSDNRIILTNDKDFGDLIFLNKLSHKGVILFRLKSRKTKDKIKVFENLLKNYPDKLSSSFVVVDESKVRIRI